MKKLLLTLPLIAAILSFASCNSTIGWVADVEDDLFTKSDLYGKWTPSNPYIYSSFEFILDGYGSQGYYLAVKDGEDGEESSVVCGTFYISDEKEVTLSDIGVMNILTFSETTLSYEMTLEGEDSARTHYASKSDEVSDSDNTIMISTVWMITNLLKNDYDYYAEIGEDGYPVVDDSYEDIVKYEYIIFTDAGTLVAIMDNGDTQLGQWQWGDDDETTEILFKLSGESGWRSNSIFIDKITSTTLALETTNPDGDEIRCELDITVGNITKN